MKKQIMKDKKKVLKALLSSEKAQVKNTLFLKRLEREREILSCNTLPSLEMDFSEYRLKSLSRDIKCFTKYILRSQMAIARNMRRLRVLEKKYEAIVYPRLTGAEDD